MDAGAVTAADLKALLGVLNESSIAVLKHRSLVTIATAAVLSYEGLVGSQWETIGNEEQRLVDASSGGNTDTFTSTGFSLPARCVSSS